MTDVELLDWQFRIAKMGRRQLEVIADAMADHESRTFSLDRDTMARLERTALIGNTEAMLNRVSTGGSGSSKGGSKKTSTLDLSGYYAARDAEDAEARDRADRAEIRAVCEHRLAHMTHRGRLRYVPKPSPLKAFIDAHEMPSD